MKKLTALSAGWLRYTLPLLMMTMAGMASADVPRSDVGGNPDITTIWVVGDIDMVARAFGMVALLFNSNSGSMMVSAIQFGILVALFMTALVMATTGKVDVIRSVIVILFLSFAIVPTTSVYVASYYDNASVGNNAGAVGFRKVDNIPVGVAYTLGLFSKLGKTFAEGVDTASTVLPDVTWTPDRGGAVGPTAGALSLHGTQGFFSPLRTIISLRRQFNTPESALIMANMAAAANVCGWANRWEDVNTEGFLKVLTSGHQSGMTEIRVPSNVPGERPIQARMDCASAGKVIAAQVLQRTTPALGKNYSPAAEKALASRSMAADSGTTVTHAARLNAVQAELNELPSALASAVGSSGLANEHPSNILATAYAQAKNQGYLSSATMAQFYTAGVAIDSASIQAAAIFNNVAQRCIGARDPSCEKEAYILADAISTSAVDAAGEASVFRVMSGHFLNLMLYLYIVMTPFMVFILVIRSAFGLKILGAYIMMAAWINSWLPLDTAIAHYMQQQLADNMYKAVMALIASGNPGMVMSPLFTNNMFDSLQQMILTGSSLMAYIPTLIFFLLGGSAYAFAQIANRANLVGQNAIREELEAPKLETSPVIGTSGIIQQSSTGGPLDSPERLLGNADANSKGSISLSSTASAKEAAQQSVSDQLSKIQSETGQITFAHTRDYRTASESGYVITKDQNDNVAVRFVEKGETILRDGEQFAISADGSLGLKAAGNGATVAIGKKGVVDNGVSYTDGQSIDKGFSTSTNISEAQRISTAFGEVDSQSLSQAISQTVSDLRSDQASLSQATDTTLSSGVSASIDHQVFNGIGMASDGYLARQQMSAAVSAAGRYDAGVANTLQDAAANGGGALFNKLLKFSNGNESQQLAATAALREVFNGSDKAAAQPYADMLESRMDVLEHSRSMRHDVGSRLNGDISSANADGLGRYANDIGIDGRIAAGQGRLNAGAQQMGGMAMSIAERRMVMEYNADARLKAAQEMNDINKQLRQRGVGEKLGDNLGSNLVSSAAGIAGDIKDGNYAGALNRMAGPGATLTALNAATGVGKQAGGQFDSGSNFSIDSETQKLMNRRAELQRQMDGYNPNDAGKTFDGSPIEGIIGRPLKQPAGQPIEGAAYLPTGKSGLSHLARNDAFGGEDRNGVRTHRGTLAAAHAMMDMFDGSRHHDARFSAFNDGWHVANRPNSMHTKGLALDLVLDREGTSTEGLVANSPKWQEAVSRIAHFMDSNGFERGKDYRVGFERTGDGGATGNHIHFEFRNNAAAERFAAIAGGGRVLGLNTADGGPAVAAGSGPVFNPQPSALQGGYAYAIQSLMSKGEGDYNSVNLGKRFSNRSSTRDLSNMSVNEVMRAQEQREFNAAGRYQMIPETFKSGVKSLGLSGNERMTPELQDRFFYDYLIKKAGGGGALAYIEGRHNDLNRAMTAMAKEWASFPVPHAMQGHKQQVNAGDSYYKNHGGNRAHISLEESRAALIQARNHFRRKG